MRTIVSGALFVCLWLAWFVAQRLLGDAVFNWCEAELAKKFGLGSPSVSTVLQWVVQVGPPLAIAGLIMVGYHFWLRREPILRPIRQPKGNEATSPMGLEAMKEVPADTTVRRSQLSETASEIEARVRRTALGSLLGWDKLYEEYEAEPGKTELRLRFLPDTDEQILDTALLICFGYKVIRDLAAIRSAFVDSQIDYLRVNAPNSPRQRNPLLGFESVLMSLAKPEYGKVVVGTFIERIGLLEGGKYRITDFGEERAKNLALDLIRRA